MRNLGNGFAIRIISEEQAQESLRKLVEYVFTHPNGSISGMSYQELEQRINNFDKNGKLQAHSMGKIIRSIHGEN